jgi:ATP-dependent helicase Lhr and Lhr-like helicase
LRAVIVDEWHELLSTKRGAQTELALARLRAIVPGLRVWGLSATLGNLEVARDTLLGHAADGTPRPGRLVRGLVPKEIEVESLVPEEMDRFPWAGHLNVKMLPQVLERLANATSAIVFTNTRSQCELWFQSICAARPDWFEFTAIHHGSLDVQERRAVEDGLRSGRFRIVVATSSLDLGVDFAPVDLVMQVGSPKGVARLLQRAGRSGHSPGRTSRIVCVPTHALELVEVSAARDAMRANAIEARDPVDRPLDLLVQHLVTLALGGGFTREGALAELRTTRAYAALTDEELGWALDFTTHGGAALAAYPEYARLVRDDDGVYRVANAQVARRHVLNIGTIVSDTAIAVRWLTGGRLGTVEESFVARLTPGDVFLFSGRALEFVRVRDLTAWVRKAKPTRHAIPRWQGARMPLSTELAAAVRDTLDAARAGRYDTPELRAVRPDPLAAGRTLLHSGAARTADRTVRDARRAPPVRVSLRGAPGARGTRGAVRLSHRAARADLVHLRVQRLRLRTAGAGARPARGGARSGPAVLASTCCTTSRRVSTPPSWRGGSFARSRAWPDSSSPGYPGQQKSLKHVQASSGLLYDVFAIRSRQPAAATGAARSARATARGESLGRVLRAWPAAPCACSTWIAPRRWPSPCSWTARAEKISTRSSPIACDGWRRSSNAERASSRDRDSPPDEPPPCRATHPSLRWRRRLGASSAVAFALVGAARSRAGPSLPSRRPLAGPSRGLRPVPVPITRRPENEPPVGYQTLDWPQFDVSAHLDSTGTLHVRERQVIRFSGDWNGGERIFNVRFGQRFHFDRLLRVDSLTGAEVPLVRDSIDAVDGYEWADSRTLRWRSRLPGDAPFDNTRITYILEYRYDNILIPSGEGYVLDHEFAFRDRTGDIERFSLVLTLDDVWQTSSTFARQWQQERLEPGFSFLVNTDSRIPRRGASGQRHARSTRIAWGFIALLTAGLLALTVDSSATNMRSAASNAWTRRRSTTRGWSVTSSTCCLRWPAPCGTTRSARPRWPPRWHAGLRGQALERSVTSEGKRIFRRDILHLTLTTAASRSPAMNAR